MGRKTMVDVFKKLTGGHLLNSTEVFEDVISNHFNKFRYFYNTIRAVDMTADATFTPEYTDNALYITIDLSGEETAENHRAEIMTTIESLMCSEKNLFDYSVSCNGNSSLNISIVNKTITREDELYEDIPDYN